MPNVTEDKTERKMDDIARAEQYLNQDTGSHRASASMLALFIGAVTLLFSTGVAASTPAPGCNLELSQLYYSATFQLKNGETTDATPLRLVIGTTNAGPKAPFTAQIWSGANCAASCQARTLETDGPYTPIALEMDCKSTQLGTFSSAATLLWGRGRSQSKTPTLRFGTWLQGYEQAPLAVEIDRYSMPASIRVADRTPSVMPRKISE